MTSGSIVLQGLSTSSNIQFVVSLQCLSSTTANAGKCYRMSWLYSGTMAPTLKSQFFHYFTARINEIKQINMECIFEYFINCRLAGLTYVMRFDDPYGLREITSLLF